MRQVSLLIVGFLFVCPSAWPEENRTPSLKVSNATEHRIFWQDYLRGLEERNGSYYVALDSRSILLRFDPASPFFEYSLKSAQQAVRNKSLVYVEIDSKEDEKVVTRISPAP